MSRETRLSADRELRENHLRKTLLWYRSRIDKIEQLIINDMRSNDPDCSQVARYIKERECIKQNCKKIETKIYG
jgi:hypothetical protein